MRYLARAQERVACLELKVGLADFENKRSFNNIEPLILIKVQVAGRASFLMEGVLDYE